MDVNGFLKRIFMTLSLGLILFVYSEEIFWAFPRTDFSVEEKILTWLVYCIPTYFLAWAMFSLKPRRRLSIFVLGSMFGWFIEGIIAHTMYEELPLSISFTGMAWHGLISVLLGFMTFQNAIRADKMKSLVTLSFFIGIFWGTWAIWWKMELGYLADVTIFFGYSVILTILLVV